MTILDFTHRTNLDKYTRTPKKLDLVDEITTRRERLKSAPCLKLKKLKFLEIVKGGTLWVFFKFQFVARCNVSKIGYSVLTLVKQNISRI